MLKYFIGFLKNLLKRNVSKLAIIDNVSMVHTTARIYRFVKIYNSKVGRYSYIGPGTELVNVAMGNFCSVARSCSIGLATHTLDYISTSPIFTESKNATSYKWINKDVVDQKKNSVKIGSDVWIGNKATVLSNITIGNGAIIGAGSIVTRDVPDYAIVAGVPAKIIRYRFKQEIIEKLLEIRWWDFPDEYLKKNVAFFQTSDITLEMMKKLNNY